jgi:hypothetical protein
MQRRYPQRSIVATLALWLSCLAFSSSGFAASPKAGDIVVQSGVVKAADGSLVPYEIGTLNEPAAKSAVYAFLRTGEMKGVPSEVILPAPTFKLPEFAPPAP